MGVLSFSLSLSLSPSQTTVSQAVRPSGCQRGNKVTGWWARRPLSDHMDWCWARHHSHWLTQQGSSHNRGTHSQPGPFMLSLSSFFSFFCFLPSMSVCFGLSHLPPPLFFQPSVCLQFFFFAFPNTALFLPHLSKHYNCETCKRAVGALSLPPFFLNCSLSENVGLLLRASAFLKRQDMNVDNCAAHHPSSGKALPAEGWTHTYIFTLGECHHVALSADLLYICVSLAPTVTHILRQLSSILIQILWDVCMKQLYFCSMNKLTSL